MTVSSITGLPKDVGDSWWAMSCHLNGRPHYKYPTSSVRIRNPWFFMPFQGIDRFHRVDTAAAAWMPDQRRPRYMVQASCGKRFTRFITSLQPPEGRELCDDCILREFRRPYVYRFFNSSGDLLYVGYTVDPVQRFKQHSRYAASQRWWRHQCSHTLTEYGSEELALAAEDEAIIAEKPLYNRRGVPRSEWLEAAA